MTDLKTVDFEKAKIAKKQEDKVSRLKAGEKKEKDLHDSKARFDKDRLALKEQLDKDLEVANEIRKQQLLSDYKKHVSYLDKAEKRDIKQIKETCKHDKNHRSFLNTVDAYLSRPPLWISNLVRILIFLGFFIYFAIEQKAFVFDGQVWLQTVGDFFKGLFVPDYNRIIGVGGYKFEQSVIYLCLQTFAIAFLGTLFASLLAIPFGFLASKKLFGRWSYVSNAVLILIRTVPEIVFCYVRIRVTGFSPLTGVIVLSIQSIGRIGKRYSDGLDGRDRTFLEAYDSCGSTRFGSIRVGVFPQVRPSFLSTILYRFDLNLRTASILGLVGAGDLGRLILTYSNEHRWPQLGALRWGLIVRIVVVDLVSTQIRKKLV